METIQVTPYEFAQQQGVSYAEGLGLLNFLRARGLAKPVGKKKGLNSKDLSQEVAKGKKRTVWELPITLTLELIYRPE